MKVREILLYLTQALDANCEFTLEDEVIVDTYYEKKKLRGYLQNISSVDLIKEDIKNRYVRISVEWGDNYGYNTNATSCWC